MKTFTTLSDYKYLPLGLCLYESLLNTVKGEFTLYYLCLDDETFIKVSELSCNNIVPISIQQVLSDNPELSQYNIREYREFVWMLASYFTYYILINKKPIDVSYIDSDIYFYQDIQLMYDEISNRSVGIIRHRHIDENSNTTDGKYNVGVVYFKNDVVGRHCLDWWRDAVMYRKYPRLSTCYDQKYLEGFGEMYSSDSVCVADKTFAHGAPWHHRLYDWNNINIDGTIKWKETNQIFLFNHFSRISFDVINDTYLPSGQAYSDHTLNFTVFQIPEVKKLHDEYFEEIKKVTKKYNL